MKNTRIAKGKGRSDKEWDGVALKVGMAMLSMPLVPETVRSLGPRQRCMAVALETKVVGQLDTAKPRSRVPDVAHDENGVLCRGQGVTPSHCVAFEQIEGSSSDRRILDIAKTCNSHVGSGGKRRCSSAGNRAPGRILDVGVNTTKEMKSLPLRSHIVDEKYKYSKPH